MTRADHRIERDVVAAHDDEVGRARRAADQRHLRLAAGIERGGERVDGEEAVGLREARHRAGALADRKGDGAAARPRSATPARIPCGRAPRRCAPARARSTVSAASGGRPARARITGATNAWKVKIAEVGKPGRTTIGLSCATPRQSGLPGLSATPCTTIRRRAARRCACERSPAPFEVPPDRTTMSHAPAPSRTAVSSAASSSGKAPSGDRLAAGLGDGGGDDRAVAVVDLRRLAALRPAPPARRRSRAPRPAAAAPRRPRRGRSGQHADLARADARAAAQQRLAARDVGAGIGDELSRRRRRGAPRSPARRARSIRCARS